MDREDYKKTGLDDVSDDELRNFFGRDPIKDAEEDQRWLKKGKELSITCFVCGIVGYLFVGTGFLFFFLDILAVIMFIVAIVSGIKAKGCMELKALRTVGLIFAFPGVIAAAISAFVGAFVTVGIFSIFDTMLNL